MDEIIGKRFGMLVVQEEVFGVKDRSGKRRRAFICKCDCGNEKQFYYNTLLAGNIRSCGCTVFPRQPHKNLTGQTFARLSVLSEAEPARDKNGHQYRRFTCQCECGNETIVSYANLISGTTKSCGCLNLPKYPPEAFIGRTFGQLTVIGEAERHIQKSGRVMKKWMCRCTCGREKAVLQTNLVSKHGVRSCGCLSGRTSIRSNRNGNLLGNRYGFLTVIGEASPIERKDHIHRRIMICRCDCGNEASIAADNLLSGHTRSCGCLRRNSIQGQKFGMLTVLSRSNPGKTRPYWLCGCECGNVIEASFDDLFWGSVTNCGCVPNPYPDLTGQRFTRLTAMRPVTPRIAPDGGKKRQWLCRCDCGREVIVREDNLLKKNTRSCGCLRKKKSS